MLTIWLAWVLELPCLETKSLGWGEEARATGHGYAQHMRWIAATAVMSMLTNPDIQGTILKAAASLLQ